jgi:hypothetical protein
LCLCGEIDICMLYCVKCQAKIDPDVNYCHRCGAAQPETTGQEGPITLPDTIKISNKRATPVSGLTTTDMGKAGARRRKTFLLGAAVFILSILIGAALALGLRAYRNRTERTEPVAVNPPAKSSPAPTVVIESPKEEEESSPVPKEKTPSKSATKAEKREPSPEKPVIVPPRPPAPRPRIEELPDIDTGDEVETDFRGVISVRFRLSGEALVKVRGSDAAVIPLADSTVGDVKRNFRQPLPSEPCRVKLRQRSISNYIATIVEEPSRRNNYTVTIRVTSTYPDARQEVMAGFVLIWRLI